MILLQSYSLIFVQEIGDRTFFLVIIFASRFNCLTLFTLASLCMVSMHTLSTSIGFGFSFIKPLYTKIFVTALFLLLGTYGIISACMKIYCPKKSKDEDSSEDEFEEALQEV